jgi:hypothetical protein
VAKKNQKGFLAQLSDVSKGKCGSLIVPSAFLALAVLDAIPMPTDIGYFYTERWLQGKENEPNYWLYKTLNYYGWDVVWYVTLFGVTYATGKTTIDKLTIGAGLVSIGAITYLLWSYTTKPKES